MWLINRKFGARMRKKTLRWIILMGGVTLLSAVIYGCGENTLPANPAPAATTVTITGAAV